MKEIISKLASLLISIWAYIPIIAGILTPMFIFFPIAYSSWQILTFIINESSYYNYLNSWLVIYPWDTFLIISLVLIEIIVFFIGFGIFLSAFITLVKGRMTGENVIQTGLYTYIRHPQNLGIIIFSIPFILYIPGFGDMGIRIADILSWLLFCMIMIIICDLEEFRMKKLYRDDYTIYCSKAGYLFPKIRRKKLNITKNKTIIYFIRYFSLILFFIIVVFITNIIAEFLYLNEIVVIYR
jgi:protein-S-isoprenylcysteine O-methyltransferase Ste14